MIGFSPGSIVPRIYLALLEVCLADNCLNSLRFDGAISTRVIARPDCAFAFEVTIQNGNPHMIALSAQRPPAHFHPYQTEYIEVLEGRLGLEIEGWDRILGPQDGQVKVEPWTNHRMYPPRPLVQQKVKTDSEYSGVTKFLLSGDETAELFRLDTVFFQNWYGYQDEVVMGGGCMDLIQVLCVRCSVSLCKDPWLSVNSMLQHPEKVIIKLKLFWRRCLMLVARTYHRRGGYRLVVVCHESWVL